MSGQIFAYFGTDEGKVREEALAKTNSLVPELERDFGLEVIEGNAENAEAAGQICRNTIEAIQTLPFMGGDKSVWLKNANFFGEDQTGKAQTTLDGQEALLHTLESVPAEVTVVLSGSKISKNRRFYKGINKLGTVKLIDKPDLGKSDWHVHASANVRELSQKHGITFSPEALHLFVMMVGEDSALHLSELEKLDLFLGDNRQATEEDVRSIVANTRGGIVFEIGEAIGKKQLAHAINRVKALLDRGESAVGIMRASIIPQIRNMLFSKDLEANHGISSNTSGPGYASAIQSLPTSATSHLPRTKAGKINTWGLYFSAQSSGGKYSLTKLNKALALCLEADRDLVTTQTPELTVMTRLLVSIMA